MAKPIDAFFQIDTIRGFRYFDLAGQVMNLYDEIFKQKQVVNLEARMTQGVPPLASAVLSATRIWLHFQEPDTLTLLAQQSAKHGLQMAETLEVRSAKRLGLRTMWALPTTTDAEALAALSPLVVTDKLQSLGGRLHAAACEVRWAAGDELLVTVRLSVGQRADDAPKQFPSHSIVVDLDVFRESDAGIPITDVRRFAGSAERVTREWYARTVIALGRTP